MSRRKKDLFDTTMNTGLVGIGAVGSAGMEPMAVLPTMSAAGGVFGQLQGLNKMVKKKKR
jgi:hypothetical protein